SGPFARHSTTQRNSSLLDPHCNSPRSFPAASCSTGPTYSPARTPTSPRRSPPTQQSSARDAQPQLLRGPPQTLSPQLRRINGKNSCLRVARGNAIRRLHRQMTSGSSPASAPAISPTCLEVSPSGPTSPTSSASPGAVSRKPTLAKPDGPSAPLTWQ